ncbi:MAG: RsiV family protein [Gammaproteobacteria bacterium]
MKKLIYLLFLLLATPITFAAEVPVASATQETSAINEAILISDDWKIVPKVDKEESSESSYTIKATYPQIEGENLSIQAQEFNKLISNLANQEVQQFKKYVAADMPHMQTLPAEIRNNSLQTEYDIDVVKPGTKTLISVRLTVEGMQAGRAHPYHVHHVLNFDLTTGKVLTLNDLFKAKTKYLNVIANIATKKLNEKLTDKWMIAEGTKPLAKNFKNWNLENDGILITFDEYQVAPYVNGAQEVEISYADLKNILSPQSVIYTCVKNPNSCSITKAKV